MAKKVIILISLVILLWLCFIVNVALAKQWTTKILDTDGTGSCSLSLDSSDNVHITYLTGSTAGRELRYITNASGEWLRDTVEVKRVEELASMVLDSSDNVHIGYRSFGNIRYSTKKSGSWVTKTLFTDLSHPGLQSSVRIAVDTLDKVHVVFSSYYPTHGLFHVTNASGVWVTELVSGKFNGFYNSLELALDPYGKMHVFFVDRSINLEGLLWYATNTSGSWTFQNIASQNNYWSGCAMAVDSQGSAHIMYGGDSYATNSSGLWVINTIDAGGLAGHAMVMEDSGSFHISDGRIYATNTSGSWVTEAIDIEGSGGTDIAVDSTGKIHICTGGINGGLLYETNALPVPDIKINGSDSDTILTNEDALLVTTSLYTGNRGGENADWWILADTPSGWYHYNMNSSSWLPGKEVSYQGPLYEISSLEVLNTTGLESGLHTYSFTVDMDMNGVLDSKDSYSDSVEVNVTEKDRFALDFNNGERVSIGDAGLPDIAGRELTVEAWVKKSNDKYGIEPIIRMASGGNKWNDFAVGFQLGISGDKPFFNIRRQSSLPESIGCSPGHVTGTSSCIVTSTQQILKNAWTHIAGVLVNKAHVHPVSTSCTTAVMAEKPHLDLYINGEFNNCASSGEQFAGDDLNYEMTLGSREYCPNCGPSFGGVLDDIRFWTVARTEQELQKCMNFELGTTTKCLVDSTILKGYWDFNEGQGSVVYDSSGNGLSGVVEIYSGGFQPWDGSWVPGYQFMVDKDGDGDGYPSSADCDDNDSNVYPGATEGPPGDLTCNDGKDNDCDGFIDGNDTNCNVTFSDLKVKSVSTPPHRRKCGGSFKVKAIIKNKGVGSADAGFSIGYYLSKDREQSVSKDTDKPDYLLTDDSYVSSLPFGATSKEIVVSVPCDIQGKYYLKVCADNRHDIAETNEENNCKASKRKIKVK